MMARRRRNGGRIARGIGNGIDFLDNVSDALPLLKIIGHVIVLPFRIIGHLMH